MNLLTGPKVLRHSRLFWYAARITVLFCCFAQLKAQQTPTAQIAAMWSGRQSQGTTESGLEFSANVSAIFGNFGAAERDYVITVRWTAIRAGDATTPPVPMITYKDYPVHVGADGDIATPRISTSFTVVGSASSGTVYVDATISPSDGKGGQTTTTAPVSGTWTIAIGSDDDPPLNEN